MAAPGGLLTAGACAAFSATRPGCRRPDPVWWSQRLTA
ncbi:hypothetical protein I552_7276 [Mycobacterium xenopi 3993]|nr:hypothetical protein I552_7276 [Mycobacterium xenopi 3993]